MKKKSTADALEIMGEEFFKGKPARQAELDQARVDDAVARKIFDLRTKAGLSQRELAKRVGTTASVICRLEDADYEGHSLSMLHRIARALNRRVEIRFLPLGGARRPGSRPVLARR
ncbi:MAG TPA: helix-turn-helix transcriptional regulator [Chthoniobacteraceae bacterium]|jgi:ribosome-binding protein aMBF1 (putative translation factor)|nr:helix-turn-helix transcriptional regulator [Chthoniobacteraceae bacterium]